MTPKELLLSLAMQQGGSGGGGGYPEPTGTKQITITENGTTTENVKDYANAEVTVNVPTYPEPTGTRNFSFSSNGTRTEDVKDYANAKITVAVPEPSGTDTITIVSNGTVTMDVKDYAYAAITVAVPEPTGTRNVTITQNGSQDVDVTDYETARVDVNVQPSLGTLEATEDGTYIAADDGFDGYSTVEVVTGGVSSDYRNVIGGGNFNIVDEVLSSIRSKAFSEFSLSADYCSLKCPNVTDIGAYAFENSAFGSLALGIASCTTLGSAVFRNCTAAIEATVLSLPLVTTLSYGQFESCTAFNTVDLEACTYIGTNVFKNCACDVILRRTASRVTLGNVSAFDGFTGHVYVPDDMLAGYQTATNWSSVSSILLPLSQYVEP